MFDNFDANTLGRDEDFSNATTEYLRRADAACNEGDAVLGMHLYLAAYEKAVAMSDVPSEDALRGLKQAWILACAHKERSLAEYIFDKLEPFLTQDETVSCMDQLQSLALDRLEEFGVSREDLEEMTQLISQDLLGLDAGAGMPFGITPKIVKVEHVADFKLPSRDARSRAAADGAEVDADAQAEGAACHASGDDGGDDVVALAASVDAAAGEADEDHEDPSAFSLPEEVSKALAASFEGTLEMMAEAARNPEYEPARVEQPLRYETLAGYDNAIASMRDLGIGMQGDPDFESLIKTLNARHGLEAPPAFDTLLFRSPAREDANRFVAATIGEIDRPTLRMHMEENLQGLPVLCVTTQADNAPKMNALRNAFVDGGILVLEDIDLWVPPQFDPADDVGGLVLAALSRGSREAIGLIRSAVETPDMHVLVTASSLHAIDPFFLDLLDPLVVIDIDLPTPEERYGIWMDIARDHPSIRGVNRADLVRLSANMSRFDIYMAAREAIEDAYKIGTVMRRYRPVTRENIFDKLAAFQPLDSDEYHELEEEVVSDFRRELEQFEASLRDSGSWGGAPWGEGSQDDGDR